MTRRKPFRKASPRQEPPDEFTLYVCRSCGAWDLSPNGITHNSQRCEGRTDATHIDRVTAAAVEREPHLPSDQSCERVSRDG